MALRLAAVTEGPRPAQQSFSARISSCLGAGDLKAFDALWAEATAQKNVHARFHMRRLLAEGGLMAARTATPAKLAPLYFSIAAATVAALEDEPREPLLLNYAGVALYELGALRPAERLFRAAKDLDPELPSVAANLDHIARRRRAGTLRLPIPRHLAIELGPLGGRAEACAGRARPVEGLTLSLCMIVRDEEEMLPRCLAAARPAVDEIVVVDTGSTDRTVEIARSFGAKVVERAWTGSFSEARNASLEAATGDWILYLDADEVLVADDAERLRELTGRVWREAFYLVETNYTGELEDGNAVTHNALRVFRNRPEYRFEGRLHEQMAHRLPGFLPNRIEATSIRVEHFGYLGAVRDSKEKSRRNIELLERQAREGEATPFHAFNLGSEYAAAGDEEAALGQFHSAWKLLESDPEKTIRNYVPCLINRYVKSLRLTGDLAGARERAVEGLSLFPGFTDLVVEQALVAQEQGRLDEAAALLERCLEMGDAPSRYSATVGCGSYIALNLLAQLRRAQGRREEAEQLATRCVSEFPGFQPGVLTLAEVMLAGGAGPDQVVAAVEEQLADTPPSARFMLGTALYEAGHAEAAERQYAEVLERQPASHRARAALAEALLSQRRYAKAADAASGVPAGAYAPAAGRTELFARLLLGDPAQLAPAFERAGAAGLAEAELELFRAWADLLEGSPLPTALSPAAAPLLLRALEALLRVTEVDAFAGLLPLLDRVGLPARSKHELLASMYLRRGFLDSAADEWIGACETFGPDADSLLGLAQVAFAREMREDALVFAKEAQALEPGNAGAGRLVAALTSGA